MKREKIIFIIGLISILVGSIVSVSAVTYLYNASEVSYDNTASHLNSTDVQGAINELYDTAQDYSSMNTRTTALENYFLGKTTSYFNGSSLFVGRNQASDTQSFIHMHYGGDSRGGLYTSSASMTLAGRNGTSGNWGTGTLNLKASTIDIGSSSSTTNFNGTVNIGGTNYSTVDSYTATTNGLTVSAYKIGKVVFIRINGSPTEELASGVYYTLTTLPEGYRPPVNFTEYKLYNSSYLGQVSVATSGLLRLGYTRKVTAPTTNVAFPSSANVYLTTMYVAE